MVTLYNGIRARQIDTVGLQSDYTGTGTGPEHDPGAPWFATDCGQTNCGREPVLGRLIDYLQDGTPVYGVTEACREWLLGGSPGYVKQADWPPYGLPRYIAVREDGSATCGNLSAVYLIVYDDLFDQWGVGGDQQLFVSGGVITFIRGGCVNPPQSWDFTQSDPGVCVYPLNINPVATLTDDGSAVACCFCDATDPPALFRISVHGFHPAVHAARLVDVVGGVERWQVATGCCPEEPIPCCCYDGENPNPKVLIATLTNINDCACAETGEVSGELVWDPDFYSEGSGAWVGSVPMGDCGHILDMELDCLGTSSECNHYRLTVHRDGSAGCAGTDTGIAAITGCTCSPFLHEFALSMAACGCGPGGDFIVQVTAPP